MACPRRRSTRPPAEPGALFKRATQLIVFHGTHDYFRNIVGKRRHSASRSLHRLDGAMQSMSLAKHRESGRSTEVKTNKARRAPAATPDIIRVIRSERRPCKAIAGKREGEHGEPPHPITRHYVLRCNRARARPTARARPSGRPRRRTSQARAKQRRRRQPPAAASLRTDRRKTDRTPPIE